MSDDDAAATFALDVMRIHVADVRWQLAELDGVRVIYVPVGELVEAIRQRAAEVLDEGGS